MMHSSGPVNDLVNSFYGPSLESTKQQSHQTAASRPPDIHETRRI